MDGIRGIRGATCADSDIDDDVAAATTTLLHRLVEANGITKEGIAAALFTLADDLCRANPAAAARRMGWTQVPMLMLREHTADPAVPRCIRVLLLVNTTAPASQIRHVYLGQAAALRPDLWAPDDVGVGLHS